MHCNCCDRELSNEEIKYDPRLRGKFEMCSTCLEAVKECFEADSEEEIGEELDDATVESLYALPTEEELLFLT